MKRFKPLIVSIMAMCVAAVVVSGLKMQGYAITYQPTISMPQGFYLITPAKQIKLGDTLLFKPPKKALDLMLEKHWVPMRGEVVKNVFAMKGDFICKRYGYVWINGKKIAKVYKEYAPSKKLPSTAFCRRLKNDEYLMMSTHIKRSFDGRYFGPVKRDHILGKAKYLF